MPREKRFRWQTVAAGIYFAAAIATIFTVITAGLQGASCLQKQPEPENFPVHLPAGYPWSFQVYLQSDETLHLVWRVHGTAEAIVGIIVPDGVFFGFCEQSDRLERDRRTPLTRGSTAFRPRDYGWETGLYLVQMEASTGVVEVQVQHWTTR